MANTLARGFTKLMGGEASAGLMLIAVAVLAMIMANSAASGAYHDIFHHEFAWMPLAALNTLHAWINDGLMAIFFFVVGLEIKREVLDGDLSNPARRRLPVMAAMAGMAGPALLYLGFAGSAAPIPRGWAIPAATDIAFAVGVLAMLGKRIPPRCGCSCLQSPSSTIWARYSSLRCSTRHKSPWPGPWGRSCVWAA
nr:Na+/H+ antiporter NhaA [Novosphingobium sp. 9]